MSIEIPTPTPEDKFSFGLWTVGWQGVRPVRRAPPAPPMDTVHALEKLAELGAYGVNFHDDDVIPFGSDDATRDAIIERFKKGLADTGLVGHHRDHQPVQPPGLQGRRVHQQQPRHPPLRAAQGDAQHRPGRRARRQGLRRVGRPRGRGVRRLAGHRASRWTG